MSTTSKKLGLKRSFQRLKELEEAIISQRRLVGIDLDDFAARARLAELLIELDELLRSADLSTAA